MFGNFHRLTGRSDPLHEGSVSSVRASTLVASFGTDGTNPQSRKVTVVAPTSCAMINTGASTGRMHANVSVTALTSVTAGFAKVLEDVNQ